MFLDPLGIIVADPAVLNPHGGRGYGLGLNMVLAWVVIKCLKLSLISHRVGI